MNYLKISNSKLSVEEITDLVAHETCGAIASFIGTTRDSFEDKKVLSLEYEAYESMATKTMNEICNEIRDKWSDVKHIAIYHRIGLVPVKEASVVIAISSPHRQSSLQSVQFAIDELKKNVPIWKKELYENDESAWKENKESKIGGYQKTPAKRPKLEFDKCEVETNLIPNNLIQINADETEVARRIQCFVAKKREEIDLNNVLDFLDRKPEASEEENTCARVNSVVIRNKDSKGHLTVRRVKNEIGPQVKHEYKNTLDKLMEHKPISNLDLNPTDLPQSINERLENAEKYLKLDSNSTKNVFGRLKQIEDKILFMETISPEYHHFVGEKTVMPVSSYQQKKTYSLDDLDNLIDTVKHKIDRK